LVAPRERLDPPCPGAGSDGRPRTAGPRPARGPDRAPVGLHPRPPPPASSNPC